MPPVENPYRELRFSIHEKRALDYNFGGPATNLTDTIALLSMVLQYLHLHGLEALGTKGKPLPTETKRRIGLAMARLGHLCSKVNATAEECALLGLCELWLADEMKRRKSEQSASSEGVAEK